MKYKGYISVFLAAFLLVGLLSGCGASAGQNAAAEAPMMEEAGPQMADQTLANGAAPGANPMPQGRKWVVTVNLVAETEDLDSLLAQVFSQVEDLEGYVEDQSIENGSAYQSYRYRSARLKIRVPVEQVDVFTDTVAEHANLVSNARNLQDITLQYTDTETRLKALEVEEQTLLDLLAKAETMTDLLEIEARLTDVRYEKEQVTSRLRTYDNQVDYATVNLSIEEVREYTPVEEPTVWQRISGGFRDSLRGLGTGLVDLVVWVLAMSPYLVVWAILITLGVLLGRRLHRKRKQKKPPVNP